MKKKIILAILLTLTHFAAAEITFSEIMYNPEGSDTGREWIELKSNQTTNIENLKLLENNINHSITEINSSYEINANEYFILTSNQDNFLTDYPDYNKKLFKSSFSLSNSGEYLAIIKENIISELNYTDSTEEGYSLFFNETTKEYEQGIQNGTPGYYIKTEEPLSENNSNKVNIILNIINSPPEIKYINISPDESIEEGIQIFPEPNINKTILINSLICDDSENLDINLEIETSYEENYNKINTTCFNYTFTTRLTSTNEAKEYIINLTVSDTNHSVSETKTFEYKGLMYLNLITNFLEFTDLTTNSISNAKSIDLQNSGNIPFYFSIKGENLNSETNEINISSLEFSNDGLWNQIRTFSQIINKTINRKNIFPLPIRANIPSGTQQGNYQGTIYLIAEE